MNSFLFISLRKQTCCRCSMLYYVCLADYLQQWHIVTCTPCGILLKRVTILLCKLCGKKIFDDTTGTIRHKQSHKGCGWVGGWVGVERPWSVVHGNMTKKIQKKKSSIIRVVISHQGGLSLRWWSQGGLSPGMPQYQTVSWSFHSQLFDTRILAQRWATHMIVSLEFL